MSISEVKRLNSAPGRRGLHCIKADTTAPASLRSELRHTRPGVVRPGFILVPF